MEKKELRICEKLEKILVAKSLYNMYGDIEKGAILFFYTYKTMKANDILIVCVICFSLIGTIIWSWFSILISIILGVAISMAISLYFFKRIEKETGLSNYGQKQLWKKLQTQPQVWKTLREACN
jgi:hypothetical protein